VSSPCLDGTGRVGDDLWLLAHNDVTGRPYIQPRPMGLGLAGGLLGELVLAGAASVAGDHLTLAWARRRPGEQVLAGVLGALEREPQEHPVGEWLAYLARTAPADVAARLERSGYVAHDRGLLPWRGGRWIPTDRDSAFSPVLRVRAALDASRPLAIHDAVLAGLADACGLGFRLAAYAPARPVRPLHHAVAQLPPGLHDLIARTRAAVDSAVLTHRV
jgi:Golgi phosphoprotein 3 (GPP34)